MVTAGRARIILISQENCTSFRNNPLARKPVGRSFRHWNFRLAVGDVICEHGTALGDSGMEACDNAAGRHEDARRSGEIRQGSRAGGVRVWLGTAIQASPTAIRFVSRKARL